MSVEKCDQSYVGNHSVNYAPSKPVSIHGNEDDTNIPMIEKREDVTRRGKQDYCLSESAV